MLLIIKLILLVFRVYINPLLNYFKVLLRMLIKIYNYLAWIVLGEALIYIILAAILYFSPLSRYARVTTIVINYNIC